MSEDKHEKMNGATASSMVLLHVDGWPLAQSPDWGDDEPRIQDIELAKRLGYARPLDLRKLVRRMIKAGTLRGVSVFATVAKTSGGRPGAEFWLTEAQATKVAAKSETKTADEVLDEVIRVFMMARRGLLPQQQPIMDPHALMRLIDAVTQLTKIQSAIVARLDAVHLRMDAVEQRLVASSVDPGGTVGPYVAKQIIGLRITTVAKARAKRDASRTYRGHRAAIENDLRARLNWTGLGSQWRFLPTSRRGEVERELDRLESIERGIADGLQAQAQRHARASQTALPFGMN